jgi:hypothetical protein
MIAVMTPLNYAQSAVAALRDTLAVSMTKSRDLAGGKSRLLLVGRP